MEEDLLKRAEDLSRRCRKTAGVTHTNFLTPAEAFAVGQWAMRGTDCAVLLRGGAEDAERKCAFFLPDWMDEESFDPADYLCAVSVEARFGEPGHRDYLGAVLGLGLQREWIGDILVDGSTAYLFCLPSVKEHLLLNLDKVGRCGVKTKEIPLSAVPARKRELKERSFTVKSPRLDAVCAGMFSLSRTSAAEAVAQGLVSLNYAECLKPDAPVKAGDVISLRGKGKGFVLEAGERETKKGRIFVRTGLA